MSDNSATTAGSTADDFSPLAAAAAFRRHRALPSAHLETTATVFNRSPKVAYYREIIKTRDSDEIALDTLAGDSGTPLLVLFHGLEGCSQSRAVRLLAHHFSQLRWHIAVPHFRNCGGHPNRFPRSYHAGDGDEVAWMINYCRSYFDGPVGPVFVAGISLGGSAMIHALHKQPGLAAAAAAVNTPFDLAAAVQKIDGGVARYFYARYFLNSLRRKLSAKSKTYPTICGVKKIHRIRTLRDFDELYTAPVHKFANAEDYWHKSSVQKLLPTLKTPTLCINPLNDPIVPAQTLPPQPDNPAVVFCRPRFGGHGGYFGTPRDWLADTVAQFFKLYRE